LTDLPHNPAVEDAVIGQLLATPDRVADVVGALLEPEHFYTAANRLLFGAIRDGFYDGTPIDALTLGELHAVRLGRLWGCEEAYAVQRVRDLAHGYDGDVVDHAQLVKRDADYRALLAVLDTTRVAIVSEDLAPEQIAGELSQSAMKVATNTLATSELTSFADAGRDYVRSTREAIAARSKGIELGAYFGIAAIDQFMRGLRGGEVAIGAGEPGVGKSAVWWKGSLNFAERQALRPVDQQVGTAVVSLEMGKDISNAPVRRHDGRPRHDRDPRGHDLGAQLRALDRRLAQAHGDPDVAVLPALDPRLTAARAVLRGGAQTQRRPGRRRPLRLLPPRPPAAEQDRRGRREGALPQGAGRRPEHRHRVPGAHAQTRSRLQRASAPVGLARKSGDCGTCRVREFHFPSLAVRYGAGT
jgi:hypothetical protein